MAKARDLVPIVRSTTVDLISAHVKHARGLASARKTLALSDAWDVYSRHPERTMPSTVSERESYHATFNEFVAVAGNPAMGIGDITPNHAEGFANHMREQDIAVDTHNRKIKRLRKVFAVLKDHCDGESPSWPNRCCGKPGRSRTTRSGACLSPASRRRPSCKSCPTPRTR